MKLDQNRRLKNTILGRNGRDISPLDTPTTVDWPFRRPASRCCIQYNALPHRVPSGVKHYTVYLQVDQGRISLSVEQREG